MQQRDRNGRFLPLERSTGDDGGSTEPLCGPHSSEIVRVQLRAPKQDAWTDELRQLFLTTLSLTCNVTQASRTVGKSPQGAYRLRRREATFRRDWRRALAEGYARLEVEMLERALIAEDRVRGALTEAATNREALKVLNEHPQRVSELLYRVHRQTALEEDGADDDPDGEEALARVRERIARLRERIAEEQERS